MSLSSCSSYLGPRRLALLSVIAASLVSVPSARAQVYFQDVPDAFDYPNVDTWYIRAADIDGDVDLDVLFGRSGSDPTAPPGGPFAVYVNDGNGVLTNEAATALGSFDAVVYKFALGDIDDDGDLDLFVPTDTAPKLYVNDGQGVFVDEAPRRLPPGIVGIPRFGDIDNDGDLDLLAAAPTGFFHLNDGAGTFSTSLKPTPQLQVMAGVSVNDVDFFDADRDFDLDVLHNVRYGRNALWLNDGTGTFTDASDGLPPPSPDALHYGPAQCDADGDGDLDIWVDNAGPNRTEQLLINDGTGHFTDETVERVSGNIEWLDDNGLACVDYDDDGDLDAAIMYLGPGERLLENDGTGTFAYDPDKFTPTEADITLTLDFGDLNGDGRLDCVTGQGEGPGGLVNRLYLGTADAPIDTQPPRIIAVEPLPDPIDPCAGAVVRFAVSDSATTDDGPRLRRAFVKLEANGETVEVAAKFVGGDLYRAVLPPVMAVAFEYTACAIDMTDNLACAAPQSGTTTGERVDCGGGGGAGGGQGGGPSGGGGGGTGGAGGEGAGGNTDGDDTGCDCEMASAPATRSGGLGAIIVTLLCAARLRRRALGRA